MPHKHYFGVVKATDELNELHERIQRYKIRHPEERLGFGFNYGSILNPYREGDLTFNQAIRQLRKIGKNLSMKTKK